MLSLCERLVPGMEAAGAEIEIGTHGAIGTKKNILSINYKARIKTSPWEAHWLACHFSGGGLFEDPLHIETLVTDRLGKVSPVRMFLLERYWLKTAKK